MDYQNHDFLPLIKLLLVCISITLISKICDRAIGDWLLGRCQEVEYSIVVC